MIPRMIAGTPSMMNIQRQPASPNQFNFKRNPDKGEPIMLDTEMPVILMTGISVSNMIGSPLSGFLLKLNWLGLAGWRWMFIIEGVPAIILGIVTLFYLTDWPHQAKWLPKDEQQWLETTLATEIKVKQAKHSLSILQAFRHREVVLLTLAYFFMVTAN